MFFLTRKTPDFIGPDAALAGRDQAIPITEPHVVNNRPLDAPVPDGMAEAMVGMGCFWGVERMFWKLPGVWLTMVGYAGGHTRNPTYREVCSGQTDHNEVVRLIFDPSVISYDEILRVFWEGHDPTQGMRQGNDVGTQYRSGLYVYSPEQRHLAEASRDIYAQRLAAAGYGPVTTEIRDAPPFYYAEAYHQQYLARNPGGYCGVGGTGVACPVGIGQAARG